MSDTTVTPITPATTLGAKELEALKLAVTGLASAESAAVKALRATGFESFKVTCDAYAALGKALKPVLKLAGLSVDDASGNDALKALAAHVAESDRAGFPASSSSYVKALQVAKWDTKAKRDAFDKAGNAPDMDVYGPWLQLNATGKQGSNRGGYDLLKSLVDPADYDDTANAGKGGVKPGAKFGLLVKRGVAGSNNAPAVNVKPGKLVAAVLKMDRAALAQVKTVATVVVPDDIREAFTAQVLAQYLLSLPVADAAAAPTITIDVPAAS